MSYVKDDHKNFLDDNTTVQSRERSHSMIFPIDNIHDSLVINCIDYAFVLLNRRVCPSPRLCYYTSTSNIAGSVFEDGSYNAKSRNWCIVVL